MSSRTIWSFASLALVAASGAACLRCARSTNLRAESAAAEGGKPTAPAAGESPEPEDLAKLEAEYEWDADAHPTAALQSRGGVMLGLHAELEPVVRQEAARRVAAIRSLLAARGSTDIRVEVAGAREFSRYEVELAGSEERLAAVGPVIEAAFADMARVEAQPGGGDGGWVRLGFAFAQERRDSLRAAAMRGVVRVLRNRLALVRVPDVTVHRTRMEDVLVQCPNAKEDGPGGREVPVEWLKQLVAARARIELGLVDEAGQRTLAADPALKPMFDEPTVAADGSFHAASLQRLESWVESAMSWVRKCQGDECAGPRRIAFGRDDPAKEPNAWRTYLLASTISLASEPPSDVTAGTDEHGITLSVALGPVGTARLLELSRTNVGRQLVILLDGSVLSAPVLTGPIANGALRLPIDENGWEGTAPLEIARRLAVLLKAGSYEVDVSLGLVKPFPPQDSSPRAP